MTTIGVIGAGVMGEALISGLVRAGIHDRIVVAEKRPERAEQLKALYPVDVTGNVGAASEAEVLLLVVKPQDMRALLAEIHDDISPDTLVISLAAGIPLSVLQAGLPAHQAVIRAMPNTPALVDEGMTALAASEVCTPAQLEQAHAVLASVGKVVTVPENYLDAVTAISGSGPAYIFYIVEAMIDAGVLLGLPRALASELVTQTLVGSAVMVRDTGTHPTVLRENVSSPAGTTVAAVRQLDERRVRAGFMAAIEAARDRSVELAGGQ